MKRTINNIRQIIDNLSEKMYEIYYTKRLQVFFKGYRSLLDDVFIDKGTLATVFFRLGSIYGNLKGRYIVYKDKLSRLRTKGRNSSL